ncbi:MAG: GNAT family N-acetyltransferase [Opitutae bacterium]|nr:GNAT family N-acetyltransferase [Opitutae bacterium]
MNSPAPSAILPARLLRLRDGGNYRLRPLGPGDEPLVREMFASLSPESIRARYGYLIRDMTPERAHRLVAADPARDLAIGILERPPGGGEILWAIGRLVHAPDNRSAECAFLVHDAKRRLGMASYLLIYLRLLGRRRGVPRLFAQVRRENRAMLGVFRKHGGLLHFDPAGEVVEVDIPVRTSKILFDKPPAASSPAAMASPEKKSFSIVELVVDLVLCAAFFGYIFSLIKGHVPSLDPQMILLWGGLSAGCMTGVFWLALQMVKTVYRFQRANQK